MDEVDAYRAAKLLLDSKGDGAEEHVRQRADAVLTAGDAAGWNAWARIGRALDVLQGRQPLEGQLIQ